MKNQLMLLSLLLLAACEINLNGSSSKSETVPGFNGGPDVEEGRAPFSGSLSYLEEAAKVEHVLGDTKQHHFGFLKNIKSLHFNDFSVAALRNDGSVVTWQICCTSSTGSVGDAEVSKDIVNIYQTQNNFVGLKANGSLVGWGYNLAGIDSVNFSEGIKEVVTTSGAYGFVKNDGSLLLAGNASYGGSSNIDFSVGVKQLVGNSEAFAALLNDGSVVSWGSSSSGGVSPTLDSGKAVKKLYSNKFSFLAVYEDGTATAWGNQTHGGNSSGVNFLSGIKEVYSNEYTYLVLKNDKSLAIWGDSGGGANTALDLTGPFETVYPHKYGYFAVRENGSVLGWGSYSGDASVVDFTSGIKRIVSDSGHIALKNDGSVVTWGQYPMHFNYSHLPTDIQPKSNIVDVTTMGNFFGALRSDGMAVVWGDGWFKKIDNVVKMYRHYQSLYVLDSKGSVTVFGPDSFDSLLEANKKLVKNIYSNGNATVAIHEDNSLSSWGMTGYGANVSGVDLSAGVKKVIFNEYSFSALLLNGEVISWGHSSYGGNSSSLDLTNVIDITATYEGFSALKSDGSLISWGADKNNFSTAGLDLSDVVKIFSTRFAIAFLKEDGSVLTIGPSYAGGVSSGLDLTNIKNIYSSNNGFVALKHDGSAITWGSNYSSINSSLSEGIKEIYSSADYLVALKDNGELVQWGSSCVIDKTKNYATGIGVKNGVLLVDTDGLLVPACGVNHGGYNSLYADDFKFQTDGANIYLFK